MPWFVAMTLLFLLEAIILYRYIAANQETKPEYPRITPLKDI
jgi:hypothetical protein